MVELRNITKANLDEVLSLKVSSSQESFVSSNAHSLAKAWAYKDTAFPFAIYADGVMVGFIMLGYYEERAQYTLWRFMIDERYQNRGYGKAALRLGINYLIDRFNVESVYTGVVFQNTVARRLYRCMGFEETGVTDETCLEMRLQINRLPHADL